MNEPTGNTSRPPAQAWGALAIVLGALALCVVLVQIGLPALQPHEHAGTRIGEIAGEIRRAAWRSFLDLPKPPPQPAPAPASAYLALVAPVLGTGAIMLALISALLRENLRFAAYGAALGITALVFQYLWWMAILIAGVVLLVAILQNIGDIFSF